MAVVRSTSSHVEASATAIEVPAPAGAQAGDILVAFITTDNNTHGQPPPYEGAIVAPSEDWEIRGVIDSAHVQAIYSMILSGAPEASYTFTTPSTAGPMRAAIVCINPDGDTFGGFDELPTYSFPTAAATVTLTDVPGVEGVFLASFSHDGGAAVSAPPAGMDECYAGSGDSVSLAVYSEVNPAGATFSRSITFGSSDELIAFGVRLPFTSSGGGSNTRPATPTCSASSTGQTTADLASSAFSDADGGDAHAASQWQVTLSSDPTFASPVFDSGTDASNLVSRSVTGLTAATEYIARVRHRDDSADAGTEWSEWSAASAAFTTDAAPSTTVDIDQSDPQAILVGGTVQLSATVSNPSGATSWASDDELVATVDATGEVTGVGVGSAEITATNNGISDSITVTVGAAVGSISDTVTLGGTPVQGARVWLINSTDQTLDSATTDENGEFSFDDLPIGDEYTVAVEYESGGTQYSAVAKPFLTPS